MSKGKKKKNKKDLDFQKVKLKIGKRIKKDDDETKAQFSTRKIVLKEVKSYSNDPLTSLLRHSEHISHQGKLSLLNHFNSALTADIAKTLNKPIIDSLAKFIMDQSSQVRVATIKCFKTCYNHLRQQHLSTKDFMYSLKPYLDCAYTHVANEISTDCQKFIQHLVNINDPHIFEPLMSIVLRRYEIGNLTEVDKKLASLLRHYYVRHKQKQSIEETMKIDRMVALEWTEQNYLLDLNAHLGLLSDRRFDSGREVRIVNFQKREDIVEKYLALVPCEP